MIQDYLLETSSFQKVKQFTRSETSMHGISRSCLDHCYSDVPEKLSEAIVVSAGNSDHLALIVRKYSKALVSEPQTIRKRNYKTFCIESFLTDINESVTSKRDLEEAAVEFEERFSSILELHAPMETYQMRKNYLPTLSQETKILMAERQALQEEAVKLANPILL